MSRLFIVTASHLTSDDSVKYLEWMYESVTRATKDITNLTVSFVTSVTASSNDLKDKLKVPSNCTLLRPKKDHLHQFDHFFIICIALKDIAKPNDYVMIMDDDDMMLEFPSCFGRRDVFGGSQLLLMKYTSTDVHEVGIDRLLELLPQQREAEVFTDLSGHCMKMKYFELYFRCKRPKIPVEAKHFEDIAFMEYLASLTKDPKNQEEVPVCWAPERPFIFHRLKKRSEWKERTAESFKKVIGTTQALKDKINILEGKVRELTTGNVKLTEEIRRNLLAFLSQKTDGDETCSREYLEKEFVRIANTLGDPETPEGKLSSKEIQLARNLLNRKRSTSGDSSSQTQPKSTEGDEFTDEEIEGALALIRARAMRGVKQTSQTEHDKEEQLPSLVMMRYEGIIRRLGVGSEGDV